MWKTFKLLVKRNRLTVLQWKQYVFCITISYLRSVALKVELKSFSYALNQDRYRCKEVILWVLEMTLTTKSEAATC
jgi:hypothetical protein